MNNLTILQLVEAIAYKFQIEFASNISEKVALYTMMLPDILYQKLFQTLSAELNAEVSNLHQLFIEQVSKYLLKSNNHYDTINLQHSGYKLKQTHIRKQSLGALEIQNQFVAAVKQVLLDRGCSVNAFLNHRQLCVTVNEHLKENRPLFFWRDLRQLIPNKTEVQLREYYQKSFLRHMYEESISVQDKIILCDLVNQMPGARPSKIADEFAKMVGTGKYFYRNIVMYIVNKKEK
ncbi:Hypothetical_protein [Hexamita inflata]|uniref:Hypothetical_protein n=1 Tax=Hexamita inflata TaxID=28002 RepID=A0AA86UPS6_9EUKA|nr:Hypothetical protein HINF_LOCUS54525 [Hexamita inflata]